MQVYIGKAVYLTTNWKTVVHTAYVGGWMSKERLVLANYRREIASLFLFSALVDY